MQQKTQIKAKWQYADQQKCKNTPTQPVKSDDNEVSFRTAIPISLTHS